MNKGHEFDKDDLMEMTFGSKGVMFDGFEIVQGDEIVNSHKYNQLHELVFHKDGKFYRFNYYHHYDDGVDTLSFETVEVEPYTVTKVMYRDAA